MLEELRQLIQKALQDIGGDDIPVVFEHPDDLSHGDYSTNIALLVFSKYFSGTKGSIEKFSKEKSLPLLSRQERKDSFLGVGLKGNHYKNAKAIAEKIVMHLTVCLPNGIEKVEIAPAGFINFTLSRDFFVDSIKKILSEKEHFGKNTIQEGKTVMIEYTQPNVLKTLHIGHLMSNIIGESLTRMYEWNGATVIRANYQGDVGLHIAKTLWGMQKKNIQPDDVDAVGQAYAYGHEMFETDETAKAEIVEINKKVYASDSEIMDAYTRAREASLARFETIYKKLGTKFDEYFFESETWPIGKKLVEEGLSKGIFEESEGAVVFKGEQYGLHTRVFLTKEGLTPYEAKDLGLAVLKTERRKFDENITITAIEQDQYFNVVFKALELLRPELAGKFKHMHHGMMTLTTGKMSSRTGNVITGESLIADMVQAAKEKMHGREGVDEEKVSEQIAIAAIKYMVLKQKMGKNIAFDPEKSLSLEGDSGPYLQYATVRARSVLKKAHDAGIFASTDTPTEEASTLEKYLYRFPEIVSSGLVNYAPQAIVGYLTELASTFNSWYAAEKIVDENDKTSQYKVALTESFVTVMTNGLTLLAIPVPESM